MRQDNIYAFYARYQTDINLLESQIAEFMIFALINKIDEKKCFLFEEMIEKNKDADSQRFKTFLIACDFINFTHLVVKSYHYIDLNYEKYLTYKESLEDVCNLKIIELDKLITNVEFEW